MEKSMDKQQREQFWADAALQHVSWYKPWQSISAGGFIKGDVRWFIGGQLNISVNCLDRHLLSKGNHTALIWEGDNENEQRILNFATLYHDVCQMANVLKQLGITKGDVVAIYLPTIPEAVISMLACARIGAIHTVVFAGFSAAALKQRLQASGCKLLITADAYDRGGKTTHLKKEADKAIEQLSLISLIVKHKDLPISLKKDQYWWHELRQQVSSHCEPTIMDAEDPLFILYTSGSTGQPKGLVHTSGGYLVQTAFSHHYVFNCSDDDVFWCTADVGWITGHSYVVYGALCNGLSTLLFSGVPHWPKPSRCWEIIDRYQVNVFYTAPTAIRALMRAGDEWLSSSSRHSLRLLGSVGEPINPEVWQWYYQKVGLERAPIVDTWWQTETGAIMMSPSPKPPFKPGAACQPLPGIFPVLLDDNYQEINGVGEGALAIKYPWPGIARTIAKDHTRYCQTYLRHGYYLTGDGAKRDEDGDYWLGGRIDDVLNVAGHRLGTAEIESALVKHPLVAEAAVVGISHPIKGQGIHAFVSLKSGYQWTSAIQEELGEMVKVAISAIAKPDVIQSVNDLPKTRSGKIMRRILRQIANHKVQTLDDLGDLSTLANPQCVEELIALTQV